MLTLIKNHGGVDMATIDVTTDMTPEDRGRLASLALVLRGTRIPARDAYGFTACRAEKAWILFKNGFRGVPTKSLSHSQRCITHPEYNKLFLLSNAVTIAHMMERQKRVPEPAVVEELG